MSRELPPHLKPIRFSRLKLMGQSAAHYLGQFEEEREDNDAFQFGRLAHSLILGGKIAVFDGRRAGKKWAEFQAAHPTDDIVTKREYDRAVRLAEKVYSHADAMSLLKGAREQEIAFMLDGRACGARVDVIGESWITELKTTTKAEPGWFTRNGGRLAYHAQLDWYMMGVRLALHKRIDTAHIVAVEVRHPYVVTVFDVPQATLDYGGMLWRSWFERTINCERSGQWPPYIQGRASFDVLPDVELNYGDD